MTAAAATLPWSWYTDPEVLETELQRVFRPSWQYVGHTGDLAGPAGWFPGKAGNVPVLVTRSTGGRLRALVAVCRHQGAVINPPAGSGTTVRCAYHGWVYGLDGSLQAAPRVDREPGFDPADHALAELAVGTWGPFVFVAADPAAPPLPEALGDLPDRIAAGGVDVAELRFHHRSRVRLAANWKLCVENFLVRCHGRIAHPGLSAVIDTGPAEHELGHAQFHLLYPATTISVFPGHANLTIGPVLPAGPTAAERLLDHFFALGADEEWIASKREIDDWVTAEDWALVESVQAGMAAGVHGHGTLVADERPVVEFGRWLRAALDSR